MSETFAARPQTQEIRRPTNCGMSRWEVWKRFSHLERLGTRGGQLGVTSWRHAEGDVSCSDGLETVRPTGEIVLRNNVKWHPDFKHAATREAERM